MARLHSLTCGLLLMSLCLSVAAAELLSGEVTSELVPKPVPYYALQPEPAAGSAQLPLVLLLHGGGGSRDVLKRFQGSIEEAWSNGTLPPMVIVTPSVTERGFYLDFKDGSERWESFIVGPLLAHLRQRFNVRKDSVATFVTGVSMGGMGSLRLAFKHPDVFGAVAALEPGIEPVLRWSDVRMKHRFWRSDALLQAAYGKPVDAAYYEANNPASIVMANADAIRNSALKIYLEAGDQDMFWLYEGTEFLHQRLWEQRIRHEYRLHYGLDHVGSSLLWRQVAGLQFLAGTLVDRKVEASVAAARARIDPLKRNLTEADHYGVDAALVKSGGAR